LLLARRWTPALQQRSIDDQCVYQTLRMLVVCARAPAVERRLTAACFVQVEQE